MTEPNQVSVGTTKIDTSVPHAARVYDYMLGGKVNFEADRVAAEQAAVVVGGMENVRSEVRANRAFLGRAVRFAVEQGIRQFLDVGTGIPNEDNVHAVATNLAPESRIVYVDKDPIVLAHAHELLSSHPQSKTAYLQADFADPASILDRAGRTLDFDQPISVMLVGLLHHFGETEHPWALVARMMDAVCSGSLLVVSHLASDIQPDEMRAAGEQLAQMNVPWVPRTHDDVARFFDSLEVVDPGVVQVDWWRPDDASPPTRDGWENPLYVGVARKP